NEILVEVRRPFAGALAGAGRLQPTTPRKVGALLPLEYPHRLGAVAIEKLWQPIRDLGTLWFALNPLPVLDVILRICLVAVRSPVAHDFEIRFVVGVVVDPLALFGPLAARAAAVALLGTGPGTMVAAPRRARAVDGDAEAWLVAVRRLARVAALRA